MQSIELDGLTLKEDNLFFSVCAFSRQVNQNEMKELPVNTMVLTETCWRLCILLVHNSFCHNRRIKIKGKTMFCWIFFLWMRDIWYRGFSLTLLLQNNCYTHHIVASIWNGRRLRLGNSIIHYCYLYIYCFLFVIVISILIRRSF